MQFHKYNVECKKPGTKKDMMGYYIYESILLEGRSLVTFIKEVINKGQKGATWGAGHVPFLDLIVGYADVFFSFNLIMLYGYILFLY